MQQQHMHPQQMYPVAADVPAQQMYPRLKTISALPLLALFLLACGDPPPASMRVGPAGGTFHAEGVEIVVPAGALGDEVEMTVQRVAVPRGYRAVNGTAYQFGPPGLRFAAPLVVRFDVGPPRSTDAVHWSLAGDPTRFEALATETLTAGARAEVHHFSIGFVGSEADSGPPDGGMTDGGDPDAGDPDAGDPDAGDPDAGGSDGGGEGITCEVVYGLSYTTAVDLCGLAPVEVHHDVQFYARYDDFEHYWFLTSDLEAFRKYQNIGPEHVTNFGDIEFGSWEFTTGSLEQVGDTLVADFVASRADGSCQEPVELPLVEITCTGSAPVTW